MKAEINLSLVKALNLHHNTLSNATLTCRSVQTRSLPSPTVATAVRPPLMMVDTDYDSLTPKPTTLKRKYSRKKLNKPIQQASDGSDQNSEAEARVDRSGLKRARNEKAHKQQSVGNSDHSNSILSCF